VSNLNHVDNEKPVVVVV